MMRDDDKGPVLKIGAAILALGLVGAALDKIYPFEQIPPPPDQHDCSGETKAMLMRSYAPEQRAVMWRQLCDEGGEKAIEDMIDARKAELAKPAF